MSDCIGLKVPWDLGYTIQHKQFTWSHSAADPKEEGEEDLLNHPTLATQDNTRSETLTEIGKELGNFINRFMFSPDEDVSDVVALRGERGRGLPVGHQTGHEIVVAAT